MTRQALPEGTAFLDLAFRTEDGCASATREILPSLGKKAPECHERLGDLLSLLYRGACCFYGCSEGDHFGQHIAGRVVSHSLGSYRLLCSGYYDESLALSRNLGEVANLFWLFVHRPEELERWRQSDKKTRIKDFSAFRIRHVLEKEGIPIPIDETRYAALCEVAVHVSPDTTPQAHNPQEIPTLGLVFQMKGFLASLNELSLATGVCAASLVPLLTLDGREQELKERSVSLVRAVGGIDLSSPHTRIGGV